MSDPPGWREERVRFWKANWKGSTNRREKKPRTAAVFSRSSPALFLKHARRQAYRRQPGLPELFVLDSLEKARAFIDDIARDLYVHPEKRQEYIQRAMAGTPGSRKTRIVVRRVRNHRTAHAESGQDADGSPRHLVGHITDITETRDQQRPFRKAKRIPGSFSR
jgi:hypothetical protein